MTTVAVSPEGVGPLSSPLGTRVLWGAYTWSWRLVGAILIQTVWLLTAVLLLAFVLPGEAGLGGSGVELEAATVPRLLTLLYAVTVMPMLLLPMRREEMATFLTFGAYGWLLCLLGSMAALTVTDAVRVVDFPLDHNLLVLFGVGSIVFLVVLLLFVFVGAEPRDRLIVLGVGLLAVRSGNWLVPRLLGSAEGLPNVATGDVGNVELVVLLVSLLYAMVAAAVVLPATAKLRGELLEFLVLAWLFALATLLCFESTSGRIIASVDGPGWEVFVCLLMVVFLAPAFGWLGMPWTKGHRVGWSVCLAASAGVVLLGVGLIPFEGNVGLIRHVWQAYDGPRLFVR